jgi:hypothetical protein
MLRFSALRPRDHRMVDVHCRTGLLSPAARAISVVPRAWATMPTASRTKAASPVSNAAEMYSACRSVVSRYSAASNLFVATISPDCCSPSAKVLARLTSRACVRFSPPQSSLPSRHGKRRAEKRSAFRRFFPSERTGPPVVRCRATVEQKAECAAIFPPYVSIPGPEWKRQDPYAVHSAEPATTVHLYLQVARLGAAILWI